MHIAQLLTWLQRGQTEVLKLHSLQQRFRVALKRQQSIPRVELCAALIGTQLAQVLKTELSLPIRQVKLWSDCLWYISSSVADSDSVSPNTLLMGGRTPLSHKLSIQSPS